MENINKWALTQARIECPCPKCHANPGEFCKTPKGAKAKENHKERGRAYLDKIGYEEFSRRHTFKPQSFYKIL